MILLKFSKRLNLTGIESSPELAKVESGERIKCKGVWETFGGDEYVS